MELFGAASEHCLKPKIKVSGQDATAQALSAILVVSGLSKFYVGLTYKFVSNEPAFSRGNGAVQIGSCLEVGLTEACFEKEIASVG